MLQNCLERGRLEAGCDEAGRGCLAGPVCAAAVILPDGFSHPELNDSKKLSAPARDSLKEVIENEALSWAVAWASPEEIDQINILQASILAMNRAITALSMRPDFLLIDGNRFTSDQGLPFSCEIRGDARFLSIAAASILAKTWRDAYMADLHKQFPGYDWSRNKGYPTKTHREAIARLGTTPHHRTSFRLLPDNEQARLF